METYPNHSVVGQLEDSLGRKSITEKKKFYAPETASQAEKETIGKTLIEEIFCNRPRAKYPLKVVGVAIQKLPPPKLGAKINSQHDYITLKATFLDGELKFTTS